MVRRSQIKKLKEKIQELEWIKDFQQELIVDFQEIVGKEMSKKYLPKDLVQQIEKKKKDRLKNNG